MDDIDDLIIHELYLHVLWSTKDQQPILLSSYTSRLYQYICDVALSLECHVIGGYIFNDHIQLIIKFTPEISCTDLTTDLKVASTLWIRTNYAELKDFEWQKSYVALTESYERVGETINGIKNSKPYREVISCLLDENDLEYDLQEVLE